MWVGVFGILTAVEQFCPPTFRLVIGWNCGETVVFYVHKCTAVTAGRIDPSVPSENHFVTTSDRHKNLARAMTWQRVAVAVALAVALCGPAARAAAAEETDPTEVKSADGSAAPAAGTPLPPDQVPEELRQWAEMAKKFKDEPDLKPEEVPWDIGWDYGEESFRRCKKLIPEDKGKYTRPENAQFRGLCSRFQDIVEETFDEQGQTLQMAFENQQSTASAVASKQSYHYLGARMMDKHINWMAEFIRSGKKLHHKRNHDEFIQRFFKFFAEVMKEVDRPGSGNVFSPDSMFDMPDVDQMRKEYLEAHPEEAPQAPPLWEPKKAAESERIAAERKAQRQQQQEGQ
jgi:hypothetical protein